MTLEMRNTLVDFINRLNVETVNSFINKRTERDLGIISAGTCRLWVQEYIKTLSAEDIYGTLIKFSEMMQDEVVEVPFAKGRIRYMLNVDSQMHNTLMCFFFYLNQKGIYDILNGELGKPKEEVADMPHFSEEEQWVKYVCKASMNCRYVFMDIL